MKRNRILYLIALGGALFCYLLRGSGAILMILIALLAYGAAAFLIVRYGGMNLSVSLTGGSMVEKNEPMDIDIKIRNKGWFPVPSCLCRVNITNRLTGESASNEAALSLGPGAVSRYSMNAGQEFCGKITADLTELVLSDPLDLFRSSRGLSARTEGIVAPKIHPVKIPADYLDSYNMESYQYSQYEKGSDPGEVFGVREYQEGDSLKQIHWKLTAKLGETTVKIPSFPIENNILLILDNLLAPGSKMSPGQKSGLVEHFFSISSALLDQNIPHSVGWYDVEDGAFCQHRISGRDHLQQAIPDLLGCGFREGELSTIYRYLESMEGAGFTNHFLITGQEERDIERLESYGAVKVFRATE